MAGKRDADGRQQDFFGVPAEPAPPTAEAPKQQPRSKPARIRALPKVVPPDDGDHDDRGMEHRLARLSVAELRTLVGDLSDEALADLVVVTIRQLKRRLARGSRNGQRERAPALDRAVQQLMAELGEQGGEDDF